MNIIESLFKKKEKAEIVKWWVFDLEKLETREKRVFPGQDVFIIGVKREVLYRKKVSYKNLLNFAEDLKVSLNSGLTILEALEISKENTDNNEILLRCEEIKRNLIKGENITTSWKRAFPEEEGEIINIIGLYEESGAIDLGFEKIATYLREKIEYREKLFKTMYYPLFIFLLASAVFIWFVNFFIPSMLLMLADVMNLEEYSYLSSLYRKIKIGVNCSAIFVTAFIIYIFFSKEGRKKVIKKLSYFKFFKKIINIFYLEAFSHYFYYLLQSGFSIIKSLDILKKDSSFNFCREETEKCIKILEDGHPLSQGMEKYDFIGKKELWKIKKGEMRGTLVESFHYIYSLSQKEKRFYFSEIITYLEPLMILAAGVTVGLSVYLFYWILFSYTFTLI